MNRLQINDKTRTAIRPDGTRIPVKDSKFTFLLTPSEEDIKAGIPGDPERCMYAMACRRLHGSHLVYVTRMLAYVELRGKKGQPELHRFMLKDPARHKIRGFDARDEVPPESVIFAAPKGKQKLDAQAESYRQWVKKRRAQGKSTRKQQRKAYVVGESKDQKPKSPLDLRASQRGMFQFKNNPQHFVHLTKPEA
jgi:hypothetical protein